jgi:integrase
MKKITINDVLNQVDGIGVSKVGHRTETGLKSENNRDYSDKVHSFGSKDNFEMFVKDLASFAKEIGFQNSATRLDKLTGEIFKTYLENKIATGGKNGKGITQRVVSNIVSHAEKLSVNLSTLSMLKNGKESVFATQSELIKIKEELRPNARANIHFNRAIPNELAEKIINSIKNEKVKIAATLQLKAGLRESEAIKFKAWQIKGDCFDIQGKGGYHRDAFVSKEMHDKIAGYVINTGSFSVSRSTYEKRLEAAFAENGVKYKGTHTLRYTFGQNSFVKKVESGISVKESLRQVSEEMGHHRPDITLHYIR